MLFASNKQLFWSKGTLCSSVLYKSLTIFREILYDFSGSLVVWPAFCSVRFGIFLN